MLFKTRRVDQNSERIIRKRDGVQNKKKMYYNFKKKKEGVRIKFGFQKNPGQDRDGPTACFAAPRTIIIPIHFLNQKRCSYI